MMAATGFRVVCWARVRVMHVRMGGVSPFAHRFNRIPYVRCGMPKRTPSFCSLRCNHCRGAGWIDDGAECCMPQQTRAWHWHRDWCAFLDGRNSGDDCLPTRGPRRGGTCLSYYLDWSLGFFRQTFRGSTLLAPVQDAHGNRYRHDNRSSAVDPAVRDALQGATG